MKRVHKTKGGFTLLEMILVVAIIVILAGAFALGVSSIIKSTKAAQKSVSDANVPMSTRLYSSEAKLKGYGF